MNTQKHYDMEEIKKIVLAAKPLFYNRDESAKITMKGIADYVTEVDTHVQNWMKEKLAAIYPEVQLMGEEKDNSDIDFSGAVWILDPVDGTTNLIHDFQASCISLGLAVDRQIILGIVYNPYTEELYWAEKNKGAYLTTLHDGKTRQLHVSDTSELRFSLVSVGSAPYKKEWAHKNFQVFEKIFLAVSDVRRIGSAAIEMAYIAAGRIDAYIEANLKPWDYAAGKLLIEEAGGSMTTYWGGEVDITKPSSTVASNGVIGDMLVKEFLNYDPEEEI